jgi:hypothetical protein
MYDQQLSRLLSSSLNPIGCHKQGIVNGGGTVPWKYLSVCCSAACVAASDLVWPFAAVGVSGGYASVQLEFFLPACVIEVMQLLVSTPSALQWLCLVWWVGRYLLQLLAVAAVCAQYCLLRSSCTALVRGTVLCA